MITEAALQRAIDHEQAWLDKLAKLEGNVSDELLGLISQYARTILRSVGVATQGAGEAIVDDAQLERITQELDTHLAELLGQADVIHRNWFGDMADQTIVSTETAILNFGKPTADRLTGALEGFNARGLEEIYAASRNDWLNAIAASGNQLKDELTSELVKAQQDGIGQHELANRIANNPLFTFENLPSSEDARRIYGAARLGDLEALQRRANVIARDAVSEASNRLHVSWTQEAGFEYYINYNPLDGRTTPGCREASALAPMTLSQWDQWRAESDGQGGRPPRLPLCRSHLFAVPSELKDVTLEVAT